MSAHEEASLFLCYVTCCALIYVFSVVFQFTKAVEAKQVAQQDAERAKFVVMRADQV